MEKTMNELLLEMQAGLAALTFESPVKQAHDAVEVIFNVILKLKDFALSYDFADDAEKILLYKEYKPLLVSELYYQLKIYRLESEKPEALRQQKPYLRKKIKAVTDWLDDHKAFNKYMRLGKTSRDAEFYLPGYQDKLYTPLFSFDRDPAFGGVREQR